MMDLVALAVVCLLVGGYSFAITWTIGGYIERRVGRRLSVEKDNLESLEHYRAASHMFRIAATIFSLSGAPLLVLVVLS